MNDSARDFVAYLTRLSEREDRAALAALRRGLGKPPGSVMAMYPYVIPYAPDYHQAAYFLLAALFAWYPDALPSNRNLGASFRHLQEKTGGDGAQRRFVALLRADRDELPTHLRHAVGLLKAHDIPISWEQLLRDVINWDLLDRKAQLNWGRSFWAVPATATTTDDHESTSATTKEDASA